MPAGFVGTTAIRRIAFGTTDIRRIAFGTTTVWSGSNTRDDFTREDAPTLGAGWTLLDPNDWLGQPQPYHVGVVTGTARMSFPDQNLAQGLLTSRAVYTRAASDKDDGYLEVKLSSRGAAPSISSAGGYVTQVFARQSTDGKNGVGLQFAGGVVNLVRRVNGTDKLFDPDGYERPEYPWWDWSQHNDPPPWGTFQAGQIVRVNMRGTSFEVYVAGRFRGSWDAGNTSMVGASYRSMGLRVDGAIDLLGDPGIPDPKPENYFGIRRYSPIIDSIELG